MDPQQRLLLEVACEALEDAGIPTQAIRGTQTAVFVGLTAYDYMVTLSGGLQPEDLDAYIPTGNAANFAAGRLAYFLGARGPAVVVDTACSSSLTAIHLACQSLRSHESDAAMVGGTNLLLNPGTSIACSRWGMLSPDGQCKTFDAGADGYVRSEGCGVVVLKRLADAQRDGNRVLAVVRGSAVNQDGASSGVTVPNGPAQQALLRQALAAAKLQPADIDYVEAHGTGTPLGDPIELEALSKVFAERTDSQPLILGSVKTNLGHLEAAAGVAGFIKTVLAVRHGYIPRHLNFTELTPYATDSAACVTIASSGQGWPSSGRPRRAGVSSFGVSGTNAHVVVEQAPELVGAAKSPESVSPVCTLVVSGKTPERVAATAGMLARWMAGAGSSVGLAEVAHTLNHHRTRHARFATVCAADREQAVAGLAALAAGVAGPGVVLPHEGSCGSGTVFVYSGQGSQWVGMGRQLLADEPAFAAAVAQLEPVFVAQTGFSLTEVLAQGRELVGIERIQPVLVGVQIALTELWRAYGVSPDAVIGHSMGEVAAAVVAGALSPAEGLRVITVRSALMARLAGAGAMALLELDAAATDELIAGYPGVSVAVHASPRQTVIAGPPAHVDALIAVVAGQDRLARRVEVDVASHHPTVDPILPELRAALADLTPAPPAIPVFSTVFGGQTPAFDADYWVANLRNPVRFAEAVAAAGAGHATFVEVSPHPLLTHAITETLGDAHHHALGTLTRDTPDTLTFHTNLNTTHTTHPPATEHPPEPHPHLPTTPWHHTHHWITTSDAMAPAGTHPLLGIGVTDPTNGTRVWESELGPDLLWLRDHRVDDACVLPGAAYAEMALAAATATFGDEEYWAINELSLDQVMHLAEETVVTTTLDGDEKRCRVEIRSRRATSEWVTHATATLERTTAPPDTPPVVDDTSATTLDPDELYQRLRGAGQQHGPAFQGIVGLSVSDSGAARAEVRLPAAARQGARRFTVHPVMMDIALQALGATKAATDLATRETDDATVILPVRLAGVRVYGDVTEGVAATGTLVATDRPDRLLGRVALTAADGRVLMNIDEIEMAVLRAPGASGGLTDRMFTLEWEAADLGAPTGTLDAVLLVGTDAPDPLLEALYSGTGEHATYRQLIGGTDRAELRNALSRKDIEWSAIVVVCPPRTVDEALDHIDQLELVRSRTLLVADIVKTVSQVGARNTPRLWIVTRGAQQVEPSEPVTLAQTGMRGVARVLVFEHPELKPTIVDIDAEGTGPATALLAELCANADHDEIALRDGRRYVNRVVPAPTDPAGELCVEPRRTTVDLDGNGAVRLQVDQPGRLDALTVHAVKRTAPEADQVEIRVTAAGLNFSDVLKTMGIYPGLNGNAPVIGGECVGIVTAIGVDVDSVELGQRVIAFGPGTFGSHVTTLADLVVPVPEWLTDHEAATFGVAYLTAWHSLCEVGRLAPGERVLIHSATGGVGLAAVSIATMIGARIYATAGSEAKRELLWGMGVEYVGDSRSPRLRR